MPKILVSMIAYRERFLAESVRDCLEKAEFPENLHFSIVSEQEHDAEHADLSFVPGEQITYRRYDLSEFRGIMWSREKTTDVDIDYDFILYTCGHNLFAPRWDSLVLEEYSKATLEWPKAMITSSGPEFEYTSDGSISYQPRSGMVENRYRPAIPGDYAPGYGFPNSLMENVPPTTGVVRDTYMQLSWVFAPRQYVLDVPIDVKMGYHGEEISLTVTSWARGWRFFATPKILYFHDTYKEYPGEKSSRMNTKRPWIDRNQKAFWAHSDIAMDRLNQLLSGNLYGDVTKEIVLSYCEETGMNPAYCERIENYQDIGMKRHAEGFRDVDPIL
jgi:hypothetical protein